MRISKTAITQFSLRIISTFLGTISLIYISNVLGPEGIGVYSLAITVTVWLWVLADPGIGSALLKRVSEGEDRDEYFTAALMMVSAIVFVLIIILNAAAIPINDYIGYEATPYIAALVASYGIYLLFNNTISGFNRVATMSVIQFVERTARPTFQIVAVFFGLGVSGLLFGYFGAIVVGSLLGLLLLPTSLAKPSRIHFRRLISFAKYSVLKMIRPRAARWTDTAVLGFFVVPNLIGVYEIAWSITLLLILATDSLVSSVFPTLSDQASKDNVEEVETLTESELAFTGVIVIPGAIGVLVIGEDLLRLFGPEFSRGIAVLPILAIWSLTVCYTRVLRGTLDALDRPDLTFRANLVYILGNLLGNITLVYLFGWVGAAAATSGAAVLSMLFTFRYSKSLLNIDFPLTEVGKQVLAALVMVSIVYMAHSQTTTMSREYVLVPVTIGAVIYFTVLLFISPRLRYHLWSVLPISVVE